MDLKRLNQRKNWIPQLHLLKCWCIIFLGAHFSGVNHSPLTWLAIAILNGVIIYHLNILGHEGIHLLIMNSKSGNDFLTRFFILSPQFSPLNLMRANHLNHHRNLGTDKDQDVQYYVGLLKDGKMSLLFKLVFSLFGVMVLPIALKLFKKKNIKDQTPNDGLLFEIFAIGISQLAIFIIFWKLSGFWWSYFFLYFLPIFTVMTGLNTIRSCIEHADPNVPPMRERTFISNRIERFFFSPLNMNYHAEHHYYPTVPFYYLPQLRDELLNNKKTIIVEEGYLARLHHLLKKETF